MGWAEVQVHTNQGVTTRGQAAIVQRLQSNAELHAAYGNGAHEIDALDPQPLDVRVSALSHSRLLASALDDLHLLSPMLRAEESRELQKTLCGFQPACRSCPPSWLLEARLSAPFRKLDVCMLSTDARCMQGGGVMVHVSGHFRVGGSGPLAVGPQGAGPPSRFSEAFLIRTEGSGRPLIINQSFQLL